MFRLLTIVLSLVLAHPAVAQSAPKTLMVVGDSLSAGYNLPHGAGVPEQLGLWLNANNCPVTIINAGVSGDTTTGGLNRIDWALAGLPDGKADLVIVELGGNDALRGIDPALSKSNLSAIVDRFQAAGIPTILAGMQAPPNMGSDYEREFNGMYELIAQEKGVALYPFFLEGVAANPDLNLPDHIHPNEKGIAVIISKLGPFVKPHLCGGPS